MLLFFFYSLEPMFPIVQFEKYLFKKKMAEKNWWFPKETRMGG